MALSKIVWYKKWKISYFLFLNPIKISKHYANLMLKYLQNLRSILNEINIQNMYITIHNIDPLLYMSSLRKGIKGFGTLQLSTHQKRNVLAAVQKCCQHSLIIREATSYLCNLF